MVVDLRDMGRAGAPSTTSMAQLNHIRIEAAEAKVCLDKSGCKGSMKLKRRQVSRKERDGTVPS
jgi:hypothetical protein